MLSSAPGMDVIRVGAVPVQVMVMGVRVLWEVDREKVVALRGM